MKQPFLFKINLIKRVKDPTIKQIMMSETEVKTSEYLMVYAESGKEAETKLKDEVKTRWPEHKATIDLRTV